MRRFLISFITLILTNIVYSQNDVVVSQPKCEDLKGYNFSGIKWVDKDGTYYPDFPINGIVKMCDDKGLITLEMLFVKHITLPKSGYKTGLAISNPRKLYYELQKL